MQESYKVEHKEKYYISVEKVWSNIKKWWPVVTAFFLVGIIMMVTYSKKEYQQSMALYEAQKGIAPEQTEMQNDLASAMELENAYCDLTQIAACMEQLATFGKCDYLEQVNSNLIEISKAIEASEQGEFTITKNELANWISEAKTKLKEAVTIMATRSAKEIVLRLDILDGESYAYALSELRAVVSQQSEWNQWTKNGEQVYVIPDADNLPESEKKMGVDSKKIRILLSTDDENVSTTAENLCEYLNTRYVGSGFEGHVVVYENIGSFSKFLPTVYNQIRTQSVNIAFRFAVAEQANDNAVLLVEPSYRLVSRGSMIRFALFFCAGCAFLFVMIMIDHKVRTEEEFYDLFGESPIAVIKKKNNSAMVEQVSNQLVYLAKEKNWQKIGLLYVGKSSETKKVVDVISNCFAKEKVQVTSASREEASLMYGYDEVIVFYDSESVAEKMMNQIITELNQVDTNLVGMVIC